MFSFSNLFILLSIENRKKTIPIKIIPITVITTIIFPDESKKLVFEFWQKEFNGFNRTIRDNIKNLIILIIDYFFVKLNFLKRKNKSLKLLFC
jgi:hypothetical protein